MAQLNEGQIEELKAKHGDIFVIEVDGKFGYLKKPDRKTMGIAAALSQNAIRSNEALLNGCWVAGDEEIKTNDELFMSVQGMLGGLLEIKAATIKKL